MTAAEGLSDVDLTMRFDKRLWSTTPGKAARVILGGVCKNRARILVGPDTKALDLAVRITGPTYQRIVPPVIRLFIKPIR